MESVSFVITLWVEPHESDQGPEWRWRVTRVQTGESAYFRRVADLLRYVGTQAGLPPPR